MPKLNGQDVTEKAFYDYVRTTMEGGLVTDYPKMLYKAGEIPHNEHHHQGEPIKIGGIHDAQTLVVNDADEELAALEDGWAATLATPEPKRGPGRPRVEG
jgi:hypothetical protein